MSVNQVTLLGRVGRTPEIRTVGQNNSKVAQFSLCTGGKYKTSDGREVDDTAWHSIVAWRSLADIAERFIDKGSQILVIGHLSYRKYTDNNGVEKSVTDIVADKIELCSKSESRQSPAPAPQQQKFNPQAVHTTPIVDDLPEGDSALPF